MTRARVAAIVRSRLGPDWTVRVHEDGRTKLVEGPLPNGHRTAVGGRTWDEAILGAERRVAIYRRLEARAAGD